MEFLNETSLNSYMARAQLFFRDLIQVIVVVKGTFDVSPAGDTQPSETQLPLLLEDTETPYGTLETEIVPAKAWCDLAVLGHARSRSPTRPVKGMTVTLRIGPEFKRSLRVTGDRTWRRSIRSLLGIGRLVPSKPVPFCEMPLTYARAFGGYARQIDDTYAGHFTNPEGRGMIVRQDDVPGAPLPNVEEPDQLMRAWTDRPLPAGFAPLPRPSALRAQRGVKVDLDRQLTRIDASAFCFAHPRMFLPAYPHAERGHLDGVLHQGRWHFRVPPMRHAVRIDLGAARYDLPLVPDTIYLLPDERRIAVVARCTFVYQFVPERVRSVRVVAADAPGEPAAAPAPAPADAPALRPLTTIRRARIDARPSLPIAVDEPEGLALSLEPFVQAHPLIELIEDLPLCASG